MGAIGTIVEPIAESVRLNNIKYWTMIRYRIIPPEQQLDLETNQPISE
jgi:hypothetical protein